MRAQICAASAVLTLTFLSISLGHAMVHEHPPATDEAIRRQTRLAIVTADVVLSPTGHELITRYNGVQGTTKKVLKSLRMFGVENPAAYPDQIYEWQLLHGARNSLFEIVQAYQERPQETLNTVHVDQIISAIAQWATLEMTGLFCGVPGTTLPPTSKLSDDALGQIRGHLQVADQLIQNYAPNHAVRFLVRQKIGETWARQAQHYKNHLEHAWGQKERAHARKIFQTLTKNQEAAQSDRDWACLWDARMVALSLDPRRRKEGLSRLQKLQEKLDFPTRLKELAARTLERASRLEDRDFASACYWFKRASKWSWEHPQDTLMTPYQGLHDMHRMKYVQREAKRLKRGFDPESVHEDGIRAATGDLALKILEEPLPAYATPPWMRKILESYIGPLNLPPLQEIQPLAAPDFKLPKPYRLDTARRGEKVPFFTRDELGTIRSALEALITEDPFFSKSLPGKPPKDIYAMDVIHRLFLRVLKQPEAIPTFMSGLMGGWNECTSGSLSHLFNILSIHFPGLKVASPRTAILQGLQTHWEGYLYQTFHKTLDYHKPKTFSARAGSPRSLKAYEAFLKKADAQFGKLSAAATKTFMAGFHTFAAERMNEMLKAHHEPPLTDDERHHYVNINF